VPRSPQPTVRSTATESVCVPAGDFLTQWAFENPTLPAETRTLLTRWLDDPTDRPEVAAKEGMSLGALLRVFNQTAPLADPVGFRHRETGFLVRSMAGTCDEVIGDGFPKFGSPVTLRVYYADPGAVPQAMFEAADWTFMDAGEPGFLGYAYGVRHSETLYLAGLRSELAMRCAALFQNKGGEAEIRVGDDVERRATTAETEQYANFVPVLRQTFQRYWIQILLGAAVAWARTEPALSQIGLLWPEEDRGGVVRRIYRELPHRLSTRPRWVSVGGSRHHYLVTTITEAALCLATEQFAP
jgi:hypothetical protein